MNYIESQITIHAAFLPGQESKGKKLIVIIKEQNVWIIKSDPLTTQWGQHYLPFNFANRVNDAIICS